MTRANNYLNVYTAGETYKLTAPTLKRAELFQSYKPCPNGGSAACITYALLFKDVVNKQTVTLPFYINGKGETLAQPTTAGEYEGRFIATDAAGSSAEVYTWTFVVKERQPFATTPAWDKAKLLLATPDSQYSSTYAVGSTYTLARPSLRRDELFNNFAGDSSKITYAMEFKTTTKTWQNTMLLPFYVNGEGETLAQPNLVDIGSYDARLVGTDGAGAKATVYSWKFTIKLKQKFDINPASGWQTSGDGATLSANDGYSDIIVQDTTPKFAGIDSVKYPDSSLYTATGQILYFMTFYSNAACNEKTTDGTTICEIKQGPPVDVLVGERGRALGTVQGSVGKYTGRLFAQLGDDKVVVREWPFAIVKPATFAIKTSSGWDMSTSLGDIDGYKSSYILGAALDFEPIKRDLWPVETLFVGYKDKDQITYAMRFRNVTTGRVVNSVDTPVDTLVGAWGKAKGTANRNGKYKGQLVVQDGVGEVVIKEWAFEITGAIGKFKLNPASGWNTATSLNKAHNYLAVYPVNKTFTLAAPNKNQSELFSSCKADPGCKSDDAVAYDMAFCNGKTSEGRTCSGKDAQPPGKFFLAKSGEALAEITGPEGNYTGYLRASNKGTLVVVKFWNFEVLVTCPDYKSQIKVDGRCEYCAAGSEPVSAGGSSCAIRDCPAGCSCSPQDVLASRVHVHCSDVLFIPPMPLQTKQLRLTGGGNPVPLLQNASFGRAGCTSADQQVLSRRLTCDEAIVVVLDPAVLPKDPVAPVALPDDGEVQASASEAKLAPARKNNTVVCVGADTVVPSKVHISLSSPGSVGGALPLAGAGFPAANATGVFATVCKEGGYAAPDGSGCRHCDRGGFYQDEKGKLGWFSHCACKECKTGTYSESTNASNPAEDCTVCPPGTDTTALAGYRACPCLADSSRTDRFGGCTTCKGISGIECTDDSQRTKPGYWWQFASKDMQLEYTAFATNLGLSYDYNRSISIYTGLMPPPYLCPQSDHCLGGIDSACASRRLHSRLFPHERKLLPMH